MFDEPSSYLDVKQRLKASRMIRSLIDAKTYLVVVEHDVRVGQSHDSKVGALEEARGARQAAAYTPVFYTAQAPPQQFF